MIVLYLILLLNLIGLSYPPFTRKLEVLNPMCVAIFFAVLLSPVLDGFDQLIKLCCTVLAVN